jgi:hypothetical protein
MGPCYPVLRGLFGAFFHQDWSVDHATTDDVVTAFIADSGRDELAMASNELESLLALRLGGSRIRTALAGQGSVDAHHG